MQKWEVKKWFDEIQQKYNTDSIEQAKKENRLAIRTFNLEAAHNNTNTDVIGSGILGGVGLKAINNKISNPAKDSRDISCSILPTTPFYHNEKGVNKRIGLLFTLPSQEDQQIFNDVMESPKVDPNLKQNIKEYFTSISYFANYDLMAKHFNINGELHYKPNISIEKEGRAKYNASHYQDFIKEGKIGIGTYNEALVNIGAASKFCIVGFDKESVSEIWKQELPKYLEKSVDVEVGLFNPETGKLKFVTRDQVITPKEEVKSILPPINQHGKRTKVNQKTWQERNEENKRRDNHLPPIR